MGKEIRLNELSKELNLSATTISRALSGNGRVSEETRKKVTEAALRLGYISPSQKKQSDSIISGRKSGNVGVVLSRDLLYESDFFHLCLLGAAGALADHGYETLLILCNTDEYEPLIPAVEKGALDGVIFTRAISGEKSHSYLKKKGIPVVVVGSGIKDAVMVDSNTALACRELASSLMNSGCKRIAFIAGNMNYNVNIKRLEGAMMGVSDYSINPDPNLIFRDISNYNSCKVAVETAITRRCDGIICCDDVIAGWSYEVLTRLGLSVPKDVLLASCFDSNELARHTPPITAAHIDARQMGFYAGEAMIGLLEGTEKRQFIPVEHTIHLRASTRHFSV